MVSLQSFRPHVLFVVEGFCHIVIIVGHAASQISQFEDNILVFDSVRRLWLQCLCIGYRVCVECLASVDMGLPDAENVEGNAAPVEPGDTDCNMPIVCT